MGRSRGGRSAAGPPLSHLSQPRASGPGEGLPGCAPGDAGGRGAGAGRLSRRMTRPYLGITGFTSATQVREALALVPPTSRRLVMVGVLASRRTCAGLPERSPRRLPAVESIPEIFPDHPHALNLVHYYTDEPATLGRQLADLAGRAGPNLHGFQINGIVPTRADLEEVRSERPALRIVFQMLLGLLASSPREAACRAQDVAGLVDDILLDVSGGQGRPLDPEGVLPYLRALSD